MKIALIGDSILDNEEYTGKEDCVFTKVRQKLPEFEVVNFAEDGITSLDINEQLERVKTKVCKWDYAFLSVGGNDLLENQECLLTADINEIHRMIESICTRVIGLYSMLHADFNKVILITPYLPVFDGIDEAYVARVHQIVKLFNEQLKCTPHIIYLELHPILNSKEDFINHIEPSKAGSEKIANLIEKVVRNSMGS